MKLLKGRKGFAGLTDSITSIITVGLLVAIGIILLAEFMGQTTNTDAIDAINETLLAVATVPGWFSLLILAVVAGVVLYLVFRIMRPSGGAGGM